MRSPAALDPAPGSVPAIMGAVLVALAPGVVVQTLGFGRGVLLHVTLALSAALAVEGIAWRVRGRRAGAGTLDGSAAVSAVLIGIAIPAGAPWWVSTSAALFGLALGKHAYGGLGHNPFNPAMVGYAFVLISFPGEMTRWHSEPLLWGSAFDWLQSPDAWSGATPLDRLRAERVRAGSAGAPAAELERASVAAALAYAGGGLWLLWRRTMHWRLPLAMLGALALAAGLFHALEPARYASAHFHLLSGAALVGAFFVVTDPVTAPAAPGAQWCYGAVAGLAVFAIRAWGGYPDGVAFAVLAANMLTPALDRWSRP